MATTTPTQFRFTADELWQIDELVKWRQFPSRVALLRRLVMEEADRMAGSDAPPPSAEGHTGWVAAPATQAAMARSQTSGGGPYMTVAECPHPIGRRIGKACSQCGKDPA